MELDLTQITDPPADFLAAFNSALEKAGPRIRSIVGEGPVVRAVPTEEWARCLLEEHAAHVRFVGSEERARFFIVVEAAGRLLYGEVLDLYMRPVATLSDGDVRSALAQAVITVHLEELRRSLHFMALLDLGDV